MSARGSVGRAVLAALQGLAECPVFDAAPARARVPFGVVGEPVLLPWPASGVEGWEARLTLVLTDEGERPVRLRVLAAAAEGMVLPVVIEGWRVAGWRLVRSRMVRGSGGRWTATLEWVARVFRAEG